MAINCQKCLYHMKTSEAFGYLAIDVGNFLTKNIMPIIQEYFAKRGMKDNTAEFIEACLISYLNSFKVPCHVCHNYFGWSMDCKVAEVQTQKKIQI